MYTKREILLSPKCTYIVKNIKFIYTSFDEFFLPVSQRVEMNYIFFDNIRILSKAPKKLSNCLKRAETSLVLIVFDCVLCEVRAYKHICCYCFLPSLNMNQVPENNILINNQILKKISSQCNCSNRTTAG